ncbi:MAG: winged helix-turn-helix domain-containing protein [Desulfurococcales archaeon]|nr:winged helix-turn-helix domain-containing protein [Desulfurococcales archaeon]
MLVKWLIEGSRGGVTRAKILLLLREGPKNPHQLAKALNLNYRTITHHLKVLESHGLIVRLGEGYGSPYILSEEADKSWSVLESSIMRVLEKKGEDK